MNQGTSEGLKYFLRLGLLSYISPSVCCRIFGSSLGGWRSSFASVPVGSGDPIPTTPKGSRCGLYDHHLTYPGSLVLPTSPSPLNLIQLSGEWFVLLVPMLKILLAMVNNFDPLMKVGGIL